MKLYYLLILLLTSFWCFSQNATLKGKERDTTKTNISKLISMQALAHGVSPKTENGIFKKDRIIFKLEHIGNKLTASYYDKGFPEVHKKDSIFIPHKTFVAISEWERGIDVSVLTIPFKIRPKFDTIPNAAIADIKNIGLFLGNSFQSERYFYNGKISKHTFIIGGFLSPTIIKLNKANTSGMLDKELNQLGLSVGLGINYTYKRMSFILIPIGFDYGITEESKKWIYNKKYWFGFGLGVDTTLLSF